MRMPSNKKLLRSCQGCKHAKLAELKCRPTGKKKPIWQSALASKDTEFTLHTWDWWQASICKAYEPSPDAPKGG